MSGVFDNAEIEEEIQVYEEDDDDFELHESELSSKSKSRQILRKHLSDDGISMIEHPNLGALDDGDSDPFDADIQFERQRLRRMTVSQERKDSEEKIYQEDETALQNKQWESRSNRRDIFEPDYIPNERQTRECSDLMQSLGIEFELYDYDRSGNENRFGTMEEELNRRALSVLTGNAVLLKKGHIIVDHGEYACELFSSGEEAQTRELIILSNAFLVCNIKMNRDDSDVYRELEHCNEVQSITAVIDKKCISAYGATKPQITYMNSFQVIVKGQNLTFVCESPKQKQSWLSAFETIIMKSPLIYSGNKEPGWEHDILRISLYSAARYGDDEMAENILANEEPSSLSIFTNIPDQWGNTPIHYAVMNRRATVLSMLLEAGADPNKLNYDCKTPAECVAGFDTVQLTKEEKLEIKAMLKALDCHGSKDANDVLERFEKKIEKQRPWFKKLSGVGD